MIQIGDQIVDLSDPKVLAILGGAFLVLAFFILLILAVHAAARSARLAEPLAMQMGQLGQRVQGLSDGQRGIVEKAANVTPTSPNQGNQPQTGPDPLTQQLREALMGDTGMKFLS